MVVLAPTSKADWARAIDGSSPMLNAVPSASNKRAECRKPNFQWNPTGFKKIAIRFFFIKSTH